MVKKIIKTFEAFVDSTGNINDFEDVTFKRGDITFDFEDIDTLKEGIRIKGYLTINGQKLFGYIDYSNGIIKKTNFKDENGNVVLIYAMAEGSEYELDDLLHEVVGEIENLIK